MDRFCFLDLDGVLIDTVPEFCKAHSRPYPYADGANGGEYDLCKIWGITEEEFYQPLQSVEFWAEAPKTEDADQIVQFAYACFGEDNVGVLTSAGHHCPAAVEGKIRSMKKWFPQFVKKMLITSSSSAKASVAGPGKVLIDDSDKNVSEFQKAGGRALLLPREWNSAWKMAGAFTLSYRIGTNEILARPKVQGIK